MTLITIPCNVLTCLETRNWTLYLLYVTTAWHNEIFSSAETICAQTCQNYSTNSRISKRTSVTSHIDQKHIGGSLNYVEYSIFKIHTFFFPPTIRLYAVQSLPCKIILTHEILSFLSQTTLSSWTGNLSSWAGNLSSWIGTLSSWTGNMSLTDGKLSELEICFQ